MAAWNNRPQKFSLVEQQVASSTPCWKKQGLENKDEVAKATSIQFCLENKEEVAKASSVQFCLENKEEAAKASSVQFCLEIKKEVANAFSVISLFFLVCFLKEYSNVHQNLFKGAFVW